MTTRTDSSRRYADIRSLTQLRKERERLQWQIENREEMLEGEYTRFREMFSLSYVAGEVARRVSSFQSVVGGIWNGFQSTFAMVRKHQARKREEAEETACSQPGAE